MATTMWQAYDSREHSHLTGFKSPFPPAIYKEHK